jgi:hypothetical protein
VRYYDGDGASNEVELNKALLSSGAMIRRRKEDVLKELPPKRWVTVPVEMGKGADEYWRAHEDCIQWFHDLPRRIEAQTQEARKLWAEGETGGCETVYEFIDQYRTMKEQTARMSEHLVRFEALKTAAWVAKRESVFAWIAEFLEGSDKKLIVFATHREAVQGIAERFNAPTIMGGMKPEEVERAKDRFQNDPDVRVISCNIKAGGVGHTLTAASDVAFLELPWTPADLDQAVDRAHRIGQQDSVTGWVLAAVGEDDEPTIEWEIIELLTAKRGVVDAVTDGRESDTAGGSIIGDLAANWAERYAETEVAA